MKLLLLQLKNILRYKTRYIVLGVMLLLVSIVCLAAFKAQDTAERTIDKIGMDLGSEVKLQKNDIYTFGLDEIQMALDTGYVKEIEYIKYVEQLLRPQVEIVNDEDEISIIQSSMFFYVVGYNRAEDMAKIPLTEGRLPENDDECVITDGEHIFNEFVDGKYGPEFGRRIEVGDVIDVRNNNSFGDGSTHTLTVVGLAANPNPELTYDGMIFTSFIYTTFERAESFWHEKSMATSMKYGEELLTTGYDAVLNLYTYADFEKFSDAMAAMGECTPPGTSITAPLYSVVYRNIDMIGYYSLVIPCEDLKSMASLMLWIAALISVIIISVMTFLILSERRYDMGVLRCVGMGKGRIMLNMSAELLVFFLAVILISLLLGYWVSDGLIRLFPTREIDAGVTIDELTLFWGVAWKLLLAGLGFTALSSGLSMVYILRYQPMKILINRN